MKSRIGIANVIIELKKLIMTLMRNVLRYDETVQRARIDRKKKQSRNNFAREIKTIGPRSHSPHLLRAERGAGRMDVMR